MLSRRCFRASVSLTTPVSAVQSRCQGWGQQTAPSSGGTWGHQSNDTGSQWGSTTNPTSSSWGATSHVGSDQSFGQLGQQAEPPEVPEWMKASTIIDEVDDFDNGDIFEHTVQFLRIIKTEHEKGTTSSTAEQTARVDLAVVGPRLSDLSVAECALLVTASDWPETWLDDPQLSNIFETVRQRITSEASGLEGTQAACTFAGMNKNGGNPGLKRAITAASTTQSSAEALQYINRKLMKVIKAKINDIKDVSVILDTAVASKSIYDLGEFPSDLAAEWWPLLLRRFHAFERRKLLSAEQAWKGLQALNNMIESNQRADLSTLIYPVAFSLKESTTKFASSAKGVAYPPASTPELDHITRQCTNGLMTKGAEDFWWFLQQAADILSINDFKTFFLADGHILSWLVAPNLSLRPKVATLSSFVSQVLNKAKVVEPLWLSVATNLFSTSEQGATLSFADTVLLSALVSRVTSASLKAAAEDESALTFAEWTANEHLHKFVLATIEKVMVVVNDLDQVKFLYISDMLAGLHCVFSSRVHGLGDESRSAALSDSTSVLLRSVETIFQEVLLLRAVEGLYTRVYPADFAVKLTQRLKKSPKLVEALLSSQSADLFKKLQKADSSTHLRPQEPNPSHVLSKGAVALAVQTMKPSQWLTLNPSAEFSGKLVDQLKSTLIEKTDLSLGNVDVLGSLILRYSIAVKINESTCPGLTALFPNTVASMKLFPDHRLVNSMVDHVAEKVIELVMNISAGGAKAQGAMNTAKKFCYYVKLVQTDPLFTDSALREAVLAKPIILKSLKDIEKKVSATAPTWDEKMKDSEVLTLVKGASTPKTSTADSSPDVATVGFNKSVAATKSPSPASLTQTLPSSSQPTTNNNWGSAASANSQGWGASNNSSSTTTNGGRTGWGHQETSSSSSGAGGWGSGNSSSPTDQPGGWGSASSGGDGGQNGWSGGGGGWGNSSTSGAGGGGWGQQ